MPIGSRHYTLSEETETGPKSPGFKVGDRVRIAKH